MTISQERLKEILDYSPDTGEFRWKKRLGSRAIIGQRAGTLHNKAFGYLRINLDGRPYYAHRLAWFYVYGTWPHQIDHRNRDGSDNRIANLRNVTQSQNNANRAMSKSKSRGRKGIYWTARKRWIVEIDMEGRHYYVGTFRKLDDAIAARKAAAEQIHGEFKSEE